MTDILIRAANLADAPLLSEWAQAMAWETEHKTLDPDVVGEGIGLALGDAARARYFIAECAGQPAGTLMLTTEWSDWRCADWWWIQSVYIAPAMRRRGVFSALFRHVQAQAAADADVCGLRLYVERDNAAAQRTYEKLGLGDAGYRMYELPLPR